MSGFDGQLASDNSMLGNCRWCCSEAVVWGVGDGRCV